MSNSEKRLLADVLWEAANRHLSHTGVDNRAERIDMFSCIAVGYALSKSVKYDNRAEHFLSSLGCRCNSGTAFADYEEGRELQGVRYMWLLLAAKVAEDEGITC